MREGKAQTDQDSPSQFTDGLSAPDLRLSSLFKRLYIPTIVWRHQDGDLQLVDYNDEALRATHGHTAVVRGRKASSVYNTRPDILEDLKTCFEQKTRIQRELTYQAHGAAEDRLWFVTYEFIAPNLIMMLADDITERKSSEQRLRDSNTRLGMLLEQMPCVLWSTDSDLRVTSSLGGALGALNEIPNQNIGSLMTDLMPAEASPVIDAHRRALLGLPASYEIKWKGRDFQSHVETLYGADGSIIGTVGVGFDITERKQVEVALRASEEAFSKAFNSSPAPMSITLLDSGKYIFVNDSFLASTGFVRDEVIGKTALELGLIPNAAEDAKITSAIKDQGVRNLELRFRKRSGEEKVAQISLEVLTLDGRECVLTAGIDVTELRQAEEHRSALLEGEKAARRQAEQANLFSSELLSREQSARAEAETARMEWQQTFDAMAESVALSDREGRLVRGNKAFYAWCGKSPEDSIGRPLHQLVHNSQEESDRCPICDIRKHGERVAIEFPPGTAAGRPLYVALDPILSSTGEPIAFVEQVKDLSALYSARAQAERERASLNATIEQMAEGLIIFDEHGEIVRANRLAQTILSISVDEMAEIARHGTTEDIFTDLEGHPIKMSELPVGKALERGSTVGGERLLYTKPDGSRRMLFVVASPFVNEQDQLSGAVALIRDITEEEREQERIRQSDKMRALGQLSSGVAHNFNNSLAAILGYSRLALNKSADTEISRYLTIIQQSAQDAAKMVERIQDFARSQPDPGNLQLIGLAGLIRDAVEIARPRWQNDAESLGIKYQVSVDSQIEESLTVKGKQSELREVFLNIILNALDAMPTGGSLLISISAGHDLVQTKFADTGTGMTPEIQQRIFEPFFTTKGSHGLGLGLSESYRIIERLSGRIEVESRLKSGTTFTITLPISNDKIERAETDLNQGGQNVTPLKILVLDDEIFVRGALSAMLSEMGHDVAEAANAREAVELLKQGQYSLVFTDLAMPEIDGIAAAGMMKSIEPGLKIILMSGYGSERASERAKKTDSVDAVISKPFSFAEIEQIVTDLFFRD